MAPTPKKTPAAKSRTPLKTPVVKKTGMHQELRRSARKTVRSCPKTTLAVAEEQAKKPFAFKASPLNRKILAAGCMTGIPLVTRAKKVTVAKPFSFATDERLALRKKVVEVKSAATVRSNKPSGARIAKPVPRPPLRTTNNRKVEQ